MLDIEINKPTLLLVDDEPVNLRVLKQLLAADYQLIFAKSGEEALKLATSRQPNLILLDIMMPGMTGFDVCRHLNNKESPQSPIISAPISGWAFMVVNSSSVNFPGFNIMLSAMPILPMSCIGAA